MNAWHHLPDLYFLHIPKTAGTSVRAWAEQFFPQDAILPVHHLKAMEELSDDVIRSTRFASGHFGWRYAERREQLGSKVEVFTFLRDVVSLHMSMLAYVANLGDDDFQQVTSGVAGAMNKVLAFSKHPRLEEFVTRDEIDIEDQMRRSPPGPRDRLFVLHVAGYGNQVDDPIHATPENEAKAKERLSTILSLGVVEDMDGSFALLCDRLGLPFVPIRQTLNTTEKKLKPSAAYRELVKVKRLPDVRLHQSATELVAERRGALLKRYGVSSVDELAAPMRAAFLATERGVERMREAEITMADGLVSEGLAPRFFHEPYGRWLRWAARQSTLYLPLDSGSDRHVRFEIATTMNDRIRDALLLSVNGHDIPLTRSYETWVDKGWHVICEGTIPTAAMQPGAQYTALDFAAPEDVETDYPESMGVRAAFALADIRIT
ncbi:MAG: hypothetical protein MEQ84_06985 [Mesorhizobium sp.]|nr:hypothetical protein [Mesorhizobium sp.]